MNVTRRDACRLAIGAACSFVAATLDAIAAPSTALAIAGVDDAVVGGAVLVLLTLAGYAVSSEVSQATLSAMGYSFSDFASDANNQAAAVTRAIADANNLGVEVNRAQAESAAQAIAAGTGAVGEWFAGIAESGRMQLDGIVNGVGAIPAALWGLIAQFRETMLDVYDTATADTEFAADDSYTVGDLAFGTTVRVVPLQTLLASTGITSWAIQPTWCIVMTNQQSTNVLVGNESMPYMYGSGSDQQGHTYLNDVRFPTNETVTFYEYYYSSNRWQYIVRRNSYVTSYKGLSVSADMVIGPTLPGVDRASDAPETYGAGYDKTIVGADAVYGPTGDVVSAGTIQVPVQYPHVQLPYVDGLYELGAGVVNGLLDVPIAGDTSIVVGTEQGVVSMPISQAVATDTSITAAAEPSVPVVPPGTPDVGPWTPAYDLPFGEVWPFNVIYTFVDQLSVLGGR